MGVLQLALSLRGSVAAHPQGVVVAEVAEVAARLGIFLAHPLGVVGIDIVA